MNKKYDVAILGWWHNSNYGSIMTYYALNKAISSYGYSTVLIHESLGYPDRFKLPEDDPAILFAQRQKFDFKEQEHYRDNGRLNDLTNMFLVGSDQLWNPYISRINDDLFLNFTDPEKKRIAYGTSIGNFKLDDFQSEYFGPDFEKTEKQNLHRFDWISMRENDGVVYFKKKFDLTVSQVIDPVFLIDYSSYYNLADRAIKKTSGKYILAFILDPNMDKERIVRGIADKLGFEKIVVYTDANKHQIEKAKEIFQGGQYLFDDSIYPENWLNAYKNASYVVTDSFHGSAFAFIFQKPFSVFYNKIRGTNRFSSLMELFKLGDSRRIYEEDTIEDVKNNSNISIDIDFSSGNSNMKEKKYLSEKWLKQALCSKKNSEKILEGASMFVNRKSKENNFSESIVRTFLLQNSFAWYREGQENNPMATGVELLENGSIFGIENSKNSVYWKMVDGKLIFLNCNKKPTTILNIVKESKDKNTFKGVWQLDKVTIHILEEMNHYNETLKKSIIKIVQPDFEFTSNDWICKRQDNIVNLRRKTPGKIGDQAIINIPRLLKKGIRYQILIDWQVSTYSLPIFIHLKNKISGEFQVIHAYKKEEISSTNIIQSLAIFIPNDSEYDQLMFSSFSLTGINSYLSIKNIEIFKDNISIKQIEDKGTSINVDQLKDIFIEDFNRYRKYYAPNRKAHNSENVRSLMMFMSHAIEKGLSHKKFRAGFGSGALNSLAINMDLWYDIGNLNDNFFRIACSVVHEYLKRHDEIGFDVSSQKSYFSKRVMDLVTSSNFDYGGVVELKKERITEKSIHSSDFINVVNRRRSIREYDSTPVNIEEIKKAIEIALTTPSVCNRQGSRVHLITDQELISKAMEYQGGYKGYSLPPALLLITNEISSYSLFTERNQPFIDGGLFAMSLLLALEYKNLASCTLNAMFDHVQDAATRDILHIPESEAMIAYIAVGNKPESTLVPKSKRLSTEDIVVIH